ncbi:P-loop NTPase family protein [Gillisia marina]|uniref:AAA family ATPase n=1 Tax=Gillisia marina TaxID=1167637 RepID=UPI00029A1509|nr:AAA family ATPase [Gillisia marina]
MEIKVLEPSEVTSDYSSKKFQLELDGYINVVDTITDSEKLKRTIIFNFSELANFYTSASDKEFQKISSGKGNSQECYLLNYALAKSFKDLMLLHRDVFLQLHIVSHKFQENVVDKRSLEAHLIESKSILLQALNAFQKNIEQEHRTIIRFEKSGKDISRKIKHHQNPWPVYKDQFENILEQIQLIDAADKTFKKIIEIFNSIKNYTVGSYENSLAEAKNSEDTIEQLSASLEVMNDNEAIPLVVADIDLAVKKIETSSGRKLEGFTDLVEDRTKSLSTLNFPTDINAGLLLIKKIDFNKSVKKWLDYELLPYLIDLWEKQNNLASYYKHSLLNLKSSLKLITKNKSLTPLNAQIVTLKEIQKTIGLNITKQQQIISQIEYKLANELLATNVYKPEEFLEVSFQSSINQYTTESSGLLIDWFHKAKIALKSLNSSYEKTISSQQDNSIEKAINCIKFRMVKEENAHYDTLFLNKNFIGDLFLVPRVEEETKLYNCFNDWQKGFNKSALITGNNLSGKSTLMEDFAKKHFGKDIILLETDSTITIEGRKFKTTKNLKEALQEVNKNIYNTKPVLLIDDLEYWRSEEISFLDNVRALVNFVLSESDRTFVMVSMSKAMQRHLDQRLPFSNAFTTRLNLNKTRTEEIFKAVLIRHGASHKKLVNKDMHVMSPKQIENNVQELCSQFKNNIGEVLQAWAYSTKMTENNLVIFEEAECNFEDFFSSEELIILKYVYLYKYVNEVLLKNFLGKSYNINFDSGIKRLVNTKVLWRNSNGNLILNRVITSDIFEILRYRGTIK